VEVKTMKLQINVSDVMVKEIDKYAEMMGVSRSALCATFIGQGIMSYNKSFEMLGSMGEKLKDSLLAEKAIKESVKVEKE
jgi:hypothetical protein